MLNINKYWVLCVGYPHFLLFVPSLLAGHQTERPEARYQLIRKSANGCLASVFLVSGINLLANYGLKFHLPLLQLMYNVCLGQSSEFLSYCLKLSFWFLNNEEFDNIRNNILKLLKPTNQNCHKQLFIWFLNLYEQPWVAPYFNRPQRSRVASDEITICIDMTTKQTLCKGADMTLPLPKSFLIKIFVIIFIHLTDCQCQF